jgi:ferric-dicitrate binding protein FerR (iron transport regulator)
MDTQLNPKDLLDDAISAVRDQEIEKTTVDAASARAWERISRELNLNAPPAADFKIRGCSDVQALLPKYRAGRLSEDHALIVRDHLAECMECKTQNSRVSTVLAWRDPAPTSKLAVNHTRRYAIAAALMVGAGITSFIFRDSFLPAPKGFRATVQSIDGSLLLLASGKQRALSVGQEIGENEWVRTPRGSHAILKLRDGSVVEMKERSEFGVSMNRRDTTVHLERGNVIVQAAHRRSGHLYVDATDCFVSVTGTVFAVNRGTKGSRVSVVEGEVKVQRGELRDVLHSGDQIATDQRMSPVSVQDEIAWSANLNEHLALLKEFSGLRKNLEAVRLPGLRYDSRLLKTVPDDTVLYASIPNYGQALGDANRLFQDRIQQSAVLRDWWQKSSKTTTNLDQIVERIRLFSTYLGDEIVLSASLHGSDDIRLVVMSEVQKPGLREFIEAEIKAHDGPPVRIVTAAELATLPPAQNELRILLDGNIIAVSSNTELLRSLAGRIQNAPSSSNLYLQRIASAYREGTGLLFTADLERIASVRPRQMLSNTGADSVKYLVFEQKDIAGKTENRAVVNFSGARQGMASWLAAPAPMGSLSFVSSEATVAASFVVKNPAQLLDDLIQMASAHDANFQQQFVKLESELGIRFREDLASTFGSDITISLDGPALPTPSWKAAVEVNDPVRLQQTIDRLIAEFNKQAKLHSKGGVELEKSQSNGRTVYVLKFQDHPGLEPAYSFADGYLVVASGTGVLNRAMRIHDGGGSLTRSSRFRSLMPTDGQTNFSAVVYYNLSRLTDSVAEVMDATRAVTPEQKRAFQELADSVKPTLIYAYGQTDQIQIASTGSVLGLGLDSIFTAGGLNSILERRLPGTRPDKASYK